MISMLYKASEAGRRRIPRTRNVGVQVGWKSMIVFFIMR